MSITEEYGAFKIKKTEQKPSFQVTMKGRVTLYKMFSYSLLFLG